MSVIIRITRLAFKNFLVGFGWINLDEHSGLYYEWIWVDGMDCGRFGWLVALLRITDPHSRLRQATARQAYRSNTIEIVFQVRHSILCGQS